MKQSHPIFWAAGWVGVVAGSLLAAVGLLSSNEFLNLAGGYGLMVAGCGLYLIAGLKLRQMVARRRSLPSEPITAASEPITAAKQTVTQR
ncbi:MAG TPA: hypothetical protein VEW45_00090 [Candidatus Dormibacteraeota bacterium]|nr:hypothetical protein [Candidatus Dormibacteraeota bacterium]